MPVEITGIVSHNRGTPLDHAPPGQFDPAAMLESAKAQEAAGYDRVLIANNSLMPDSHAIATHVLAGTQRLKVLLAHRPGFIAPTMAARMLTTIDRLAPARVAVHIIAGPSDKELEADGDFTAKPDRYARADEYVGILRRIWESPAPIDHEGRFYRFNQAFSPVKPGAIPVSWAGTSSESIAACGRHADVFAMSGDTLAHIAGHRDRVLAAAGERPMDFMMTMLVILGETEAQAWERADAVLRNFRAMMARLPAPQGPSNFTQSSHAGEAILSSAESAHRHDRCLWLGVTHLAQGRFGNQATLVGTPDQVCAALMDYYAMGITRFLIRGFRPDQDLAEYGGKLFPRLRAAALAHDAANQGAVR
ncbi:alkanesulfonate monooxygenase [Novosphingobium sp. SG751A]|uniref:LLM class flavin-dependent oxidoreductase n=1 Tax=Novosphingobium sp. SG751A TaxID=2587000 RepID=UPI001552E9F7|nr:LLM class flavin-dependent oxidoreductase [Novosphingobium sp. SG751A]NOW45979.1 alkanesulfonate monooxygenase [Novosphingobium sp. SG751A]